MFAGSPIKRVGRERFVRNVMIAIGNSNDRGLAAAAIERLDDEAPLIRGAAIWALARLLPPAELSSLALARMQKEREATVAEEWRTLWPRRSEGDRCFRRLSARARSRPS